MPIRSWKYRLYPSKTQQRDLDRHLHICKDLWNSLLENVKSHYEETGVFPTRKELYLKTKKYAVFSQVAQNVADRLLKALNGVSARRKAGMKTGFPRFKPIERVKSFTYPQFGFKLTERLVLSGIGTIPIKKHREIKGRIKTLTMKRFPSGKWFAIFTSEIEMPVILERTDSAVGIDVGIEHFAFLSDGASIENPRHLKQAEQKLKEAQRWLSGKKSGSKNRNKARLRIAFAHEKLANKRRDFLHKVSRRLIDQYAFIALEDLNVAGLARGFLAKEVLDCSWAEFLGMLRYKAESAGCEVVLVDPAHTTSKCSSCGLVRKKTLAERWHECPCGASMPRDLNAARNILTRATNGVTNRSMGSSCGATAGMAGSQACGEGTNTGYKSDRQVSSEKQEAQHILATYGRRDPENEAL